MFKKTCRDYEKNVKTRIVSTGKSSLRLKNYFHENKNKNTKQ